MLFRFGNFSIDVDVERTRKYYAESSRTLTEGCDCILCQNFRAAYESLDTEIKRFFDNLGVDILKAAEELDAQVFMPPLSLCGDNAAMIGIAGYFKYKRGMFATQDQTPYARTTTQK